MSNGLIASGFETSWGVGRIIASQGDMVMVPKNWSGGHGQRGVLYVHGAGELASTSANGTIAPSIATARPLLAQDLGVSPQTDNWANATVMSSLTTGQAYLQGTAMQAKAGKILLMGGSMGALGALCWAAHNPTQVAGVFVVIPAIGMIDIWTNNRSSLRSSINVAYGQASGNTTSFWGNADSVYTGGAAINDGTIGGERDVYTLGTTKPSLFTSFPIRMWYGGSDTTAIPANVTAFATAVNGAGGNVHLVYDPNGTHGYVSPTIPGTAWDCYISNGTNAVYDGGSGGTLMTVAYQCQNDMLAWMATL
jgi:pimeloyl-ACP methyl ester carboxylesterase